MGLQPAQLAGMAHRVHLRVVDDDVASLLWNTVGRSGRSNSMDRTIDPLLHCVPLEVGAAQAQLAEMLHEGACRPNAAVPRPGLSVRFRVRSLAGRGKEKLPQAQ